MSPSQKVRYFDLAGRALFFGSLAALVAVFAYDRPLWAQQPVTPKIESKIESPAVATVVPPAPTQPTFTLTVTADDLNKIGRGLDSLPYGEVTPLIEKLKGQLTKQQAPK